jgi:hypothetical protein
MRLPHSTLPICRSQVQFSQGQRVELSISVEGVAPDTAIGRARQVFPRVQSQEAGLVRARVALEPPDSDLWQSVKTRDGVSEFRLPDKIAAIVLDNEAEADDEISALLRRCMR